MPSPGTTAPQTLAAHPTAAADPRARLRTPAAGGLLVPGVWDALSARMAAAAGFDVAFVSGFALSGALLGLPDMGYLERGDVVAAVRRMALAAPRLALLVDADTGFGSALGAARTAEELAAVGAAAVVVEDQTDPKRCGHLAGKEVVPAAEWLAKLVAVREAAPDLVLVARTDAAGPLGLPAALDRAAAAAAVGADLLFVEVAAEPVGLQAVAASLAGLGRPLVANLAERRGAGPGDLLSAAEAAALGFAVGLAPVTALFAATKAAAAAYAVLQAAGTARDDLAALVPYDLFGAAVDVDGHLARGAAWAAAGASSTAQGGSGA